MHKTLKNWLEELEEETILVSSKDIDNEANGNLISFGFNHDLLKEWGKDSVLEFLTTCEIIYSKKSEDLPMVFYSWFDEQADLIKISSVSQEHGKLPFGCKLNFVSLDEVVRGIYRKDSGLFSIGFLDVYQQRI